MSAAPSVNTVASPVGGTETQPAEWSLERRGSGRGPSARHWPRWSPWDTWGRSQAFA